MKERVDSYPERQKLLQQMKYEEEFAERGERREHIQITKSKDAYTPYINEEADLPTIHEAYQYLVKTYVENVILRKEKKKNVMKKSKAINAFIGDKTIGDNDNNNEDDKEKEKKKKKKKKPKTERDEVEEENQKLLSQIEDMVGNLGVADPMTGGSSVSRSRRGSRVPVPGKILSKN